MAAALQDRAGKSEYEAARDARQARNAKLVEALGIRGLQIPSPASAAARQGGTKRRVRRSEAPPPIPSRRSSRLSGVEGPSYDVSSAALDAAIEEDATARRPRKRPTASSKPTIPTEPAPDSARALRIADGVAASAVGQVWEPEHNLGPKAYVMARLLGGTAPPRFSKYSGIQEWRNAIVLFVNVSGKAGQRYKNVFVDNFTRMTWFAQKYHVDETPVVQRLLKQSDPVLLFCRQEGMPYVFCGRVALHAYDPSCRPLKFVWELDVATDLQRALRQIAESDSG